MRAGLSRRVVALGATVAAALLLAPVSTAQADDGDAKKAAPTASIAQGSAAPGETVAVDGDGWAPGSVVQLATCGQLAINGSASCDPKTTTATPIGTTGVFESTLLVGSPPVPCPCVVRVATVGEGGPTQRVDVPLNIEGQEYSEVNEVDPASTPVRIDRMQIGGGESLRTALGGAVTRTITLTLTNSGPTTLVGLPVRAGWGDGAESYESAKVVGAVDEIPPGETVKAEVPLELPTGAFGTYDVSVFVGETGPTSTTTTHYPWLLMLLLAVGLVLLGLALWRWFAKRRKRELELDAATSLPAVSYIPELGGYLVRADARPARHLRKHVGGTIQFDEPHLQGVRHAEDDAAAAVIDLGALDDILADHHPADLVDSGGR